MKRYIRDTMETQPKALDGGVIGHSPSKTKRPSACTCLHADLTSCKDDGAGHFRTRDVLLRLRRTPYVVDTTTQLPRKMYTSCPLDSSSRVGPILAVVRAFFSPTIGLQLSLIHLNVCSSCYIPIMKNIYDVCKSGACEKRPWSPCVRWASPEPCFTRQAGVGHDASNCLTRKRSMPRTRGGIAALHDFVKVQNGALWGSARAPSILSILRIAVRQSAGNFSISGSSGPLRTSWNSP